MNLIEDVKFAIGAGKKVKAVEVGEEVHVSCEGVFHFVFTKEEADEIKAVIYPKEKPIVTITDMKNKGKKFEITYKGQTISRITKRDYKYVVIANNYSYGQNGRLVELGFSSRYDLACKNLESYRVNNVTIGKFYQDEAFRKPENLKEIENKKYWENLQIVELA